jgi:hypothetical protein
MGLDELIWMRGNPFLGPFEGVGPHFGFPRIQLICPALCNQQVH